MNNLLFEYSGNKIRILRIDSDKIIFIDQLEFVDSDFFYLEPKINFKKVNEFSDLLVSHLKKNNLFADSIKFVLDSRLAYINCIPLDFKDEVENINSSLIWELSNFYPESYKNFKVNYQRINTNNGDLSLLGNTLIIAYHKNISEVTRRISELSSLKISNINFDIFTAGNFINKLNISNFVSVGCKKDRVDISFYLNGKISFFVPFFIKENQPMSILTEMRKILSLSGFEEVSDVFFYGDESTPNLFNFFESSKCKLNIHLTDPFRFYKLDSTLIEDRPDKLHSYSFAPLFGIM